MLILVVVLLRRPNAAYHFIEYIVDSYLFNHARSILAAAPMERRADAAAICICCLRREKIPAKANNFGH